MKHEQILFHLNCIKMCESDKAIIKRIETIFNEGNLNGWKESNMCFNCLNQLTEDIDEIKLLCEDCKTK